MMTIRMAVETDSENLIAFDHIAHQKDEQDERREFIRRSVANGTCFVAEIDGGAVGYGVLNYNFYNSGWVDMLYVRPGYRRHGVGVALLRHMETLCRTAKFFTSTNLSNLPMQSLLNKEGFVLSGVIHNLDEDDPEIVYFKRLAK